jgi:hypothetical protein
MQLKKIKQNTKDITYAAKFDTNGVGYDRSEKLPEMPTAAFGQSLQALTSVVVEVLGLEPVYTDGMVIEGFSVSHTKNGTQSMQIDFLKMHDGLVNKTHPQKTMMFRIEDPADGDSGIMEVTKKSATFCHQAIIEAKSYIRGDRAQMTFEQFAEENGALAKAEDETLSLLED